MKCTNCPTHTDSWSRWGKYVNNKKILEIDICPDCFVEQCVYNALKLFVQAPIKYTAITKALYPYLLKDEDLTKGQKKRLQDFLDKAKQL